MPTTTPAPDPTPSSAGQLVGITLQDDTQDRWKRDGEVLVEQLEAMGYRTDLRYAGFEDDGAVQAGQIDEQLAAGAKVLVVGPSAPVLDPVLEKARNQGVTVILYDSTEYQEHPADYAASIDYEGGPALQVRHIRDALGLDSSDAAHTFESFSYPVEELHSGSIYESAWNVFKPDIDAGKLVCLSDKCPASLDDYAVAAAEDPRKEWPENTSREISRTNMAERLTAYRDKKIEAVFGMSDVIALGIADALEEAGYVPGVDWPILTGQYADTEVLKAISAGRLTMTVFEDRHTLAKAVATMVDQVLTGQEVIVNGTTKSNHGEIPTLTVDMAIVTKDNLKAVLVDRGYFNEDLEPAV